MSWFSVSVATPATQQVPKSVKGDHVWWTRTGPLTEFLQSVQVDDVLCGAIVSGTDEEVRFLQDKVGVLPLLRVQHSSVPQQPDALELTSQQTVTAERRRRLATAHTQQLERGQ